MLTTGARAFQRGTVSLCRSKGFKVTVRQTLRMIQLSGLQTLGCTRMVRLWPRAEHFVKPPTLTACRFAVL